VSGIDRRGFLRTLGLRVIAEAASSRVAESSTLTAPPAPPALPWPLHPSRCASLEELRGLAAEEGLHLSPNRLEGLCRRSLRLTGSQPGAKVAEAWLVSSLRPGDSGAPRSAESIALHLDRSASAVAGTELEGSGWLTVELTGQDGDGPYEDEQAAGRSRGLRVDIRSALEPPLSGSPLRLGAHLQLPRVWSAPVQELGLDADEHAAYVRVRDRLAGVQGLEVDQGAGAGLALHRILGYADDTSGTMPGECAELAGPGRWALLAQLSVGRSSRIFVWTVPGDPDRRSVALVR
jgi:hypothetical protein